MKRDNGDKAKPIPSEAEIISATLAKIYVANKQTTFTATRWNGTIIGHMLVFWAMTINLTGFVLRFPSNKIALFGVVFAALALANAWAYEVDGRLPIVRKACYFGSAIATAISWLCALAWALLTIEV